MPHIKLIADSGSTKAEWCLINGNIKKKIITKGISPYFLTGEQIENILAKDLKSKLADVFVDEIYYYGTGCSNPDNIKIIKAALKNIFHSSSVVVTHDLMAAAKALCRSEKGIACILGTGSSSCYYNGKKIMKNSPGLGFILGDEGSGAYLGKKVIQYYLYNTFDDDLRARFDAMFATSNVEILNAVYKAPLPNRYLASFAIFLAKNRGHYMIENIIEDGINDFFFNHINKYQESKSTPIHFVGSVAYGFRDVISKMCTNYQMQLGKVLKNPMDGLIDYHIA